MPTPTGANGSLSAFGRGFTGIVGTTATVGGGAIVGGAASGL